MKIKETFTALAEGCAHGRKMARLHPMYRISSLMMGATLIGVGLYYLLN